jgi:YgiT-type zinc finger domain-containing protein
MSDTPISDKPSDPVPCSDCQAGLMRLRFITYLTWLGEELVLVPNFPAWICDVCGRREYDEKSISWLSMLLNPDAGKPTGQKPSVPRRTPPPAPHPAPHS